MWNDKFWWIVYFWFIYRNLIQSCIQRPETVRIIRITPPVKTPTTLAWSNLLNRRTYKRFHPKRLLSKVQIAVATLPLDRLGALDDYKSRSRMISRP